MLLASKRISLGRKRGTECSVWNRLHFGEVIVLEFDTGEVVDSNSVI